MVSHSPRNGVGSGCRYHLEAAILLVAGGRYPEVTVTNLDDVPSLVRDLASDAARHGARLAVQAVPAGPTRTVVVSRR